MNEGMKLPHYEEIIAEAVLKNKENMNISEKVKSIREQGFARLFHYIRVLSGEIYVMLFFFNIIAKEKCGFIEKAMTKKEIDEILKPSISRYNGNKWIPRSEYYVEAEELLLISNASLEAPLNGNAEKHVEEMLKRVYPEGYERAFGKDKTA